MVTFPGSAEEERGVKTLAIANQKGGVGKTTTTVNLGASLAERGHRCLLVDLDPQGNLTTSLDLQLDENQLSIYDAIVDGEPLGNIIRETPTPNLLACPSDPSLAGADLELSAEEPDLHRRASRLRRSLEALGESDGPNDGQPGSDPEYVLLDCPPSLGLLTVNALVAADAIIVPMQCEFFSMQGLSRLLSTMDRIAQAWNPRLELFGVLFTMVDRRTNLANQVMGEVRSKLGDRVFRSEVPRSVRLAESPSFGVPVLRHAPNSSGAAAYSALAGEVLAR